MYEDNGSTADVFSIDFTLQYKIENESHQEICLLVEKVRCSTVAKAGPFEFLTPEGARDILHNLTDWA
jgi:hypothetical protein